MNPMIQKAGDDSTNIQADKVTINHGLSYVDVKQIVLDLFHANFLEMSKEAAQVAKERAEEITDAFLAALKKNNPEGLNCAQDPDFQFALFEVQKEYAKTGDKELGDLLVDLLVDRTKQPKRSILQIVLNESILVAPKLTAGQIDALSIVFLLKKTKMNGINNTLLFKKYLDDYFMPFSSTISKNDSCYQHLEYAGCGSVSIMSYNIIELFKNGYGGILSKGFELSVLADSGIDLLHFPQLVIKCLHNMQNFQINALALDDLNSTLKRLNIDANMAEKVRDLYKNSLMSNEEIKNFIISICGYMNNIFDVWENSKLQHFELTSVGIAIGHANLKKRISEFTDLSIWIN